MYCNVCHQSSSGPLGHGSTGPLWCLVAGSWQGFLRVLWVAGWGLYGSGLFVWCIPWGHGCSIILGNLEAGVTTLNSLPGGNRLYSAQGVQVSLYCGQRWLFLWDQTGLVGLWSLQAWVHMILSPLCNWSSILFNSPGGCVNVLADHCMHVLYSVHRKMYLI